MFQTIFKTVIILHLITFTFLSSENKNNLSGDMPPYAKWNSISSSIGESEIWFQDWSDYVRLFIKSNIDTVDQEPHPYAHKTFKKAYSNARSLKKINYTQILGNIEWTESPNWSDNKKNQFKWIVNRDSKYTYFNKNLSGTVSIHHDTLDIIIKDYDKTVLEIKALANGY